MWCLLNLYSILLFSINLISLAWRKTCYWPSHYATTSSRVDTATEGIHLSDLYSKRCFFEYNFFFFFLKVPFSTALYHNKKWSEFVRGEIRRMVLWSPYFASQKEKQDGVGPFTHNYTQTCYFFQYDLWNGCMFSMSVHVFSGACGIIPCSFILVSSQWTPQIASDSVYGNQSFLEVNMPTVLCSWMGGSCYLIGGNLTVLSFC